MEIVIVILLVVLIALAVVFGLKSRKNISNDNSLQISDLEKELVKVRTENEHLQKSSSEQKTDNENLKKDNDKLREQLATSETNCTNLKERIEELLQKNASSVEEIQKLNEKNKILEIDKETSAANYNGLQEKLESQRKELEEIQKKMSLEFENVATKIIEDRTKKFDEESRKSLETIINPFNEKLKDFNNTVNETYQKGLKERTELATALTRMQELNSTLQKEANNLTKALTTDSQQQGRWGEIVLERILESSGLEKGREYKTQDYFPQAGHTSLRPDVVVYLPEDKYIIIDSKVSLTAYEKFVSAETDEEKNLAMKEHIESIRRHIKELSDKDYAKNLGLDTPEYVLMFVPIESSFSAAVSAEQKLFNEAWEKRVVVVSPATLIATLMTVAAVWKQTKQNQNTLEIADRGGKLYDKFIGFVGDFEKIGNAIVKTQECYDSAFGKLTKGSGNLVAQAEKLKQLGVKTTKSLKDSNIAKDALTDFTEIPENC